MKSPGPCPFFPSAQNLQCRNSFNQKAQQSFKQKNFRHSQVQKVTNYLTLALSSRLRAAAYQLSIPLTSPFSLLLAMCSDLIPVQASPQLNANTSPNLCHEIQSAFTNHFTLANSHTFSLAGQCFPSQLLNTYPVSLSVSFRIGNDPVGYPQMNKTGSGRSHFSFSIPRLKQTADLLGYGHRISKDSAFSHTHACKLIETVQNTEIGQFSFLWVTRIYPKYLIAHMCNCLLSLFKMI